MSWKPSRRELIAGAAATVVLPAIGSQSLAAPRPPFLRPSRPGDHPVKSIVWHLWDHPLNPAPIGPFWVESVGEWDGIGYPVVLVKPGNHQERLVGFYDHEWSVLADQVPSWYGSPYVTTSHSNVHSYVRWRRFGESPRVMRTIMEINRKIGHSDPTLRKSLVTEYLRLEGAEIPWERRA